MKKIYLLLLLLPFFTIKAQVPTCSINPAYQNEGISPDSAINFVSGTIGVAYTQNVTVRVPKDTTENGISVTFTTFNLASSTNNWGLPPGLSLAGTPSNFQFPANDSSCMVIYGTPTGTITTATTYSLTFIIDVYGSIFGSPATSVSTQTVSYYHITINPANAAGIATNKGYEFNVAQNNPNPVINNTAIKFTSPADGKAKMSVYNVTGQKVIEREFNAQHGDNSYDFDATVLENGMYLYAIELNGQRQVRRMVVAK